MNAADTIRQLQDRQGELLRERQQLLLEIAELKSEAELLRQERSEVLHLIGRSFRKNASYSVCRHLLARIENTLSESRRAA